MPRRAERTWSIGGKQYPIVIRSEWDRVFLWAPKKIGNRRFWLRHVYRQSSEIDPLYYVMMYARLPYGPVYDYRLYAPPTAV